MAQYYFDVRDGNGVVPGEEGLELSDLQAVQEETVRALVGLASDLVENLKDPQTHQMAIEVRDGIGPVMEVTFRFNFVRKQ